MKLQLTADLLDFLARQGYRYFLSRTTTDALGHQTMITLTPVRLRLRTRCLPEPYDTYFAINREPVQMAEGIDGDTLVFAELDRPAVMAYFKEVIRPLLHKKPVGLVIRLTDSETLN